ncbi:NAD-dependent epimerase/dehydratase family protein [Cellulomonas fimi]|uniref:NAD-dependent epimerase/dehydratase n=1 Tax=Cellulomonas fimi (strain ATCC 484 / DSM 20113 / JCM 1341 / CCUG 24087 / LMG 16345 / NBRC 15513 / NCIMB 8980 / NCTC 7547 / NRS-133) TaxID=590998 RepID=F4H5L9_CELFA|nr:NAD(P)-dependent oxidoreductase [Cellulomonas fimi]AEE44343.1 NAD-dependent epimerase/dehydratase [Cellulomonas fimi ATCC 484]NNH08132.1 NAD(P)-dependent oxidoreductase [Cellulomonas fimi]VEH26165.1 UDP-glucose 4-epimerase [Cellulomonas fimi]
MTRVVVTGGSGKLGRAVVADLAAHGYEVVNVDVAPPPPGQPALFTRVDLTDLGQVTEALTGIDDRYQGVDAVVHLAAIPAPGLIPSGATFANNVVATHHVFSAARRAGIRNVVWASSETVLGLPFDTPPPYAPVDEEYPVRPESTYSLGKAVEEEMARHFTRWDPQAKLIGLRFSNVMVDEDYREFPRFTAEGRRWNLWGYIDARDGAQAVRLALESDLTGFEAFIIAAPDTVLDAPSADLLAEHFPDVPLARPVEGRETLLSIDKARRLLGYEPTHTWRSRLPGAQA